VEQVASPVQPGDILAQKYRVERVLGAGAMGVVVAATHLELGSRVALKFMLPMALSGAEAVERFMKEARAAGQLTSEHVCRVTDVGRLDNGAPYIVMEYLEGKDLHETLAERGPLPIAQACDYVMQVCDAMSEAHAAGIVHRDLKPQNLFITRKRNGQNVVKVLDFGVSKASAAQGAFSQTHTAAILGSPAYMSPEQLRSSKSVDGRADLWALGVILYQLMLGRYPFDGDDFLQLAWTISSEPPTPPRTIRPAMPAELEAVILRCLEKDREKRFASADELAAALAPFAAALPRAASEPGVGRGTGAMDATMAPPSPTGAPFAPAPVATAVPSAASGLGQTSVPPVYGARSTLGGATGEVASPGEASFERPARKSPLVAGLIGAGVIAAAVAGFVVLGGGKTSGGSAATGQCGTGRTGGLQPREPAAQHRQVELGRFGGAHPGSMVQQRHHVGDVRPDRVLRPVALGGQVPREGIHRGPHRHGESLVQCRGAGMAAHGIDGRPWLRASQAGAPEPAAEARRYPSPCATTKPPATSSGRLCRACRPVIPAAAATCSAVSALRGSTASSTCRATGSNRSCGRSAPVTAGVRSSPMSPTSSITWATEETSRVPNLRSSS